LLLALPMIALYEAGILASRLVTRTRPAVDSSDRAS